MPKQVLDNHLLEDEQFLNEALLKQFKARLGGMSLVANMVLFGVGALLVEGLSREWNWDRQTLEGGLFVLMLSIPIGVFYSIMAIYFPIFFRQNNSSLTLAKLYPKPVFWEHTLDRTGRSFGFNVLKGMLALFIFGVFLAVLDKALLKWMIGKEWYILFVLYVLNLWWMLAVELREVAKNFEQIVVQGEMPEEET